MTVRLGDVTFADWISIKYEGGFTDTFIFYIDALNRLPPFVYRPLLQRLIAHLNQKRNGASLWIQVGAPGEWYLAEVKRSLRYGLNVAYAITQAGKQPDWIEFSRPPKLWHSRSERPPTVVEEAVPIPHEELKCLQVLARIMKADEIEIASLADLSERDTVSLLAILKKKGLVSYVTPSEKPMQDEEPPTQKDDVPFWILQGKGLSIALRSWGVPTGVEFTARKEENLHQIRTPHRRTSRRWMAWLRSAWPHAEIWAGWSEVQVPGLSVLPDGLAWGKIQGFETLFWLEVGDEHKSRNQIVEITKKRLGEARDFCQETGIRLVYTQLSVDWVHDAARWACINLPKDVAVVMGYRRRFGWLPALEWENCSGANS